jgi:hypothetical protein
VESTPNPSNMSALTDVSCASASACTTVGQYQSGGANHSLIERWDGTTWTGQATANVNDEVLNSVSCPSTTSCTVVGSYDLTISPFTLAEGWSGTSWNTQSTPNPAGSFMAMLNAVSCSASSACTAVGDYTNEGTFTLAERYS